MGSRYYHGLPDVIAAGQSTQTFEFIATANSVIPGLDYLSLSLNQPNLIEANYSFVMPHRGRFTGFFMTFPTNTTTGNVIFTVRINAAATALTATIPAGVTVDRIVAANVTYNVGDLVSVERNSLASGAGVQIHATLLLDAVFLAVT